MKAASVNPIDRKILRGDLKIILKTKFPLRLGRDGSGTVTATGKNVSHLKMGDEVYFRIYNSDTGIFTAFYTVDGNLVTKKANNKRFFHSAGIFVVEINYQNNRTTS